MHTVLNQTQNAGVEVPRDPERKLPQRDSGTNGPVPDELSVLEQVEPVTDHISRIVSPAFSLDLWRRL